VDLAAIVFDFDGVLANTEGLHERAYAMVLARSLGIDLTHERYCAEYLGYDDVAAFQAIARDFAHPLSHEDVARLVAEKARAYESMLDETTALFPGARGCVERCAAQVPLAIASGARRAEIELILGRTKLRGFFAHVVGAEDTTRSKPAPDPYAKAASLLGVQPSRTIAIEDSRWGLASARAAGLRTVAITTSYPADQFPSADAIVSSLNEIDPFRLDAIIRNGPDARRSD
jgi:beta-phosphoglucomutase